MKPAPRSPATPRAPAAKPASTAERVQLDEWSGPVSPRFQYKTHIEVTGTSEGATLSYAHEAVYAAGKPTDTLAASCAIPPEAYKALWSALEAAGLSTHGDVTLSAETRARVGTSFNTLEVTRAASHTRIEYTRAGLKRADGAKTRALIDTLEAWAEPLAAAAAKRLVTTDASEAKPVSAAKKPAAAKSVAAAKPAVEKKPAAAKPAVEKTSAAAKKPVAAAKPAAAKQPVTTPAKKAPSR